MKTRTVNKTRKSSPQDNAMKMWNVDNNQKFMEFVDKNKKETSDRLLKRETDEGNNATDMLIGGIMTLLKYAQLDEEYGAAVNVFIATMAKKCDELEGRQERIEELWRIIFTLNVSQNALKIDEDNATLHLSEATVVYYLYRYLWEDYEQYCKANHQKLYSTFASCSSCRF